MADGFEITPGVGGTCATEDQGDWQYQRIVPWRSKYAWTVCHEAGASEAEAVLKAAPGDGTTLYITDVVFNTSVVDSMQLVAGVSGPVILSLPGLSATGGASIHFGAEGAIPVGTDDDLLFTSTGEGDKAITVCGFVA